jgi:hypothetical protein
MGREIKLFLKRKSEFHLEVRIFFCIFVILEAKRKTLGVCAQAENACVCNPTLQESEIFVYCTAKNYFKIIAKKVA